MLSLAAHAVIEQSVCGHTAERTGNRSPHYAPHGCFQSACEDEWVFVAAASDGQWTDLCAVTQLKGLAADRSLVTLAGRKEREDEIEAALDAWTQLRGADEIVNLLQARGICAANVVSPFDLPKDEHLRQRSFWQTVSREIAGSDQPQPSLPFRQSTSAYLVRIPAPTLGIDNESVLRERLLLDEKAIETLREAGVIGELAVPAALRAAKSVKKV
jgi:crotonobetainyl-CoA:carnitine CoA-transferase CaiB-like acyl-CoA transferase